MKKGNNPSKSSDCEIAKIAEQNQACRRHLSKRVDVIYDRTITFDIVHNKIQVIIGYKKGIFHFEISATTIEI